MKLYKAKIAELEKQIEKHVEATGLLVEKVRVLTADLERQRKEVIGWEAECSRLDKARTESYRQHTDQIEKHRSALEMLVRMSGEVHEMMVEARFGEADVAETLLKARGLIKGVVTKDVLELAFPRFSMPLWSQAALGSLGAIYWILSRYANIGLSAATGIASTPPSEPSDPPGVGP